MSLSWTASILLHAFLLTLLRAAATTSISIPVAHGDLNTTTTTTFTNISSATSSSPDNEENFEMYNCFLCTGRYPLLIHRCPIYWDYCHLICDYPPTTAAPSPPSLGSSSSSSLSAQYPMVQGDDECYVMKLYMSGRYVIVQRLLCRDVAWCFLTCGGGELAADPKGVMGTATTAAIQGSFLPVGVNDAELCGTQVVSAPPSPGGGGVPAGGAHRRRR